MLSQRDSWALDLSSNNVSLTTDTHKHHIIIILLENEKFFELKRGGYRDGIKRKETR